jgi:hypothetical protein
MAIWMELRCETLGASAQCLSLSNNGPHGFALSDTQRGVTNELYRLGEQGKKGGWKRTRHGWVCPACSANKACTVAVYAS